MQRLTNSQVLPYKARLVAMQGGRCAICRHAITAGADSCLDHDHKTGACRGALCRNCNGIEGKVKNLATRAKRDGTYEWWLERLLLYYKAFKENPTNVFHPLHRTDDEKRLLRNKRARIARANKTKR